MPAQDTWTIGRLLTWTSDYLKQHGADTPRLDAEVLLAAARGCERIALYTAFDEAPSEAQRTAFRELVRRRAKGMPVAYLVGRREFYSMSFVVTPDVLIPRPETELLVIALLDGIKALQKSRAQARPVRVADVGTGSGIIGICAARHAECLVTAIDISPAALTVAADNARRLGVADRVTLLESDLFAAVEPAAQFEFIASNPPYVSEAEFAALARDVREHEPRTALVAGARGTEVIERLTMQAAKRLSAGGSLLLEISPAIETPVRERLAADGRYELLPTKRDLAGHARVVSAVRK